MAAPLTNHELLARLVALDTTSDRSNRPLIDFVCEYLDRPGFEIIQVPDGTGEKANLVVRAGGTADPENGLTLCGHVDCVPAVEPDWESDPFELTERNGLLFGRGSCDMKGSVALFVNCLATLDPEALTAPLTLVLTHDEEIGTVGAHRLATTWPEAESLPRSTVIGEPTSLRAVRMHKGHLKIQVVLRGRPAHSAFPHLGDNAIETAARVVRALAELRQHWEAIRVETSGYFPETPHPTLNVATIDGGAAINIIPERCVIEIGIRLLPGMTSPPVIEEVHDVVVGVAGDDVECTVLNESPPMLLADDAPLHRMIQRLLDQRESIGVSYASDAGPLQAELSLECVLFGPGSIDVAHRANEYLPVDEFTRAEELLERIVHHHCMDGGTNA